MIDYVLLTKPRIVAGNLVTLTAGFALASHEGFDFLLLTWTLLALSLVIGSACICNNVIDRGIDAKMKRTADRPLVTGAIRPFQALAIAVPLIMAGNALLFLKVNLLTLLLIDFGFVVYVFLYSFMKTRSVHSTLIGSLSGAIPPVAGYCAVSGQFDWIAVTLFFAMVLWQMPHFFAIGLWREKEYAAASVPILPVEKGEMRAKLEICFYIAVLVPFVASILYFSHTPWFFFGVATLLGLAWLGYGVSGFWRGDKERWGKAMFQLSLLYIHGVSLLILMESL